MIPLPLLPLINISGLMLILFYCQDLTGAELYTQPADLLHPVVYATAMVLLMCLLMIIVSYIYHHRYESK